MVKLLEGLSRALVEPASMKPALPLSEKLTIRALVVHIRREAPRPPGDAQSWIVMKAALVCALASVAAALLAAVFRSWLPILGWVVVIAAIVGWVLILWATWAPMLTMIWRRVSAYEAMSDLADRRRVVARTLAQTIAHDHDRAQIKENLEAVRSEIAACDRRKYVVAGVTALAGAVAALTKEAGFEGDLGNTVQMIRMVMPALSVGAGIALLGTLGFLDMLHRLREILKESLTLKDMTSATRC